jgi:hypothetical protein
MAKRKTKSKAKIKLSKERKAKMDKDDDYYERATKLAKKHKLKKARARTTKSGHRVGQTINLYVRRR